MAKTVRGKNNKIALCLKGRVLRCLRHILNNLDEEKIRDIIEDNVYEKDGDVMGQTEAAQAIIAFLTKSEGER